MSLTKKIRFEIFKRDSFTCQYCGKTPPEVTLEIDHIIPRPKGGSDDINNLVTACFDCNRGKTNIDLIKTPNTIKDNFEILQEKELQISEYNKLLKKIDRRINKEIKEIEEIYINSTKRQYCFSESFKNYSVKKFIKTLGFYQVQEAMFLAISIASDDALKYFCGICWNKIREIKNV